MIKIIFLPYLHLCIAYYADLCCLTLGGLITIAPLFLKPTHLHTYKEKSAKEKAAGNLVDSTLIYLVYSNSLTS